VEMSVVRDGVGRGPIRWVSPCALDFCCVGLLVGLVASYIAFAPRLLPAPRIGSFARAENSLLIPSSLCDVRCDPFTSTVLIFSSAATTWVSCSCS
jgi:hypothetical protein